MTRTTPARPFDLSELFPGIEAFASTATRLHPRPGVPGVSDSHVGGSLLWPADEPWPACQGPHLVPTETPIPAKLVTGLQAADPATKAKLVREIPGFFGTMTSNEGSFALGHATVSEPAPSPMVAVAQLRTGDIPDLNCPTGTDLLQVLWCPNQHRDASYWGPAVQLRWRAADGVTAALGTPPPPTAAREERYLPRPCVLHPEQVVEFPWWEDLPAALGRLVSDFDDSRPYGEESYSTMSMAPGWKVGGYAGWEVSDLIPMDCTNCQRRMDLILTIASSESSGGVWQPVEESHLRPSWVDPEWKAATEPTGVSVGRHGSLRIFACVTCPGAPYRLNLQ